MHAAQGALSLLLFPVVGRAFVGPGCLSALAGVAVVIYPLYNLYKRMTYLYYGN